ncbi:MULTISPECIES: copper amine oxidase N-terminal domain-containing protein [Paenibacillus]|uniref:Copper amine oxidase N-terminal domain-containing protein n=1 Tax=Paenibacillus xylanilyticus TaxID=248903 RepID=A0A7Y6BU38_9BACL|nr:copper amine oxidase N-terminal domain-containing protein [Paenibacillus xylanilyticus]NUU75042.1 copper amine oxidase N-terminal domain-containing protein [Paenibacillus xylanilyticus]
MNNNMKKVSALMVLSLALSGGAAYAATLDTTQSGNQTSVTTDSSLSAAVKVSVNGTSIADGYWNKDGKEAMIALRDLTDALGIELKWNKENKSAELTKGTLWTLVTTDKDQYSINKMLLTLGTAPQITDGKLFVPASFAEKVLHTQVNTTGNQVTITNEEDVKNVTERGVITGINPDPKYPSIHIGGTGTEGLVLNLGEDTVIKSADGKEIALADLTIGMTVEAVHAPIMTMSLPPQTPTYQVTVLDTVSADAEAQPKEVLGTSGTIENVRTTEDQVTQIEISGTRLTETAPDHVILNISEDTKLVNQNGKAIKAEELTKDAKVIGFYSPMLTRSLPPIGNAWKVVLQTSDAEVVPFQ